MQRLTQSDIDKCNSVKVFDAALAVFKYLLQKIPLNNYFWKAAISVSSFKRGSTL